MAVDSSGGLYVAGHTSSTDFPTVNAIQPTAKSAHEAFLAKFNENGKLVWSTYIGSYGIHSIRSIAADSNGNVYLVEGGLKRYVAKFDRLGKYIWIKEFGGTAQTATNRRIFVLY
ncbi:MAG: SBBP repeat-containing protein [Proteobacteria bacterium]|nr:SBBP repeat-containing protein [Pseudomonadota bacterium]